MKLFRRARELLRSGWNILRTVYWYNSLPWRLLKSGALVVLGFFCLAGANLLHSYRPDWDGLHYVMAYGFLLIPYGPIHHLLVIPASLSLNHHPLGKRWKLGKRIPTVALILFFAAVGVLGTYPIDAMIFEFRAAPGEGDRDVNPTLNCVRRTTAGGDRVECRIAATRGIHSVEVHNGGRILRTVRSSPYAFSLPIEELESVVGQKQFQVVLRDEHGAMIRRYIRSVTLLEPAVSDTSFTR